MASTDKLRSGSGDIAIVGMSLCVPGADSAAAFWENLRDGIESIRVLDEDALLAAGERPDLMAQKNYVRAAAPLDGFDLFDAEFFGFSPKEAAILDPQHRKFLETAWEAMENAGHTPESVKGRVGVFAGCGMGSYFYFNICSNPGLVEDVGMFLLRHTGNDKDFLTTRVSHVFDLTGPSVNLQTACSTSLVAVHYAARALRDGDCDMALAGGVTIELPQGRGYLYKENEVLSPDGHCHAFDHRAQGTVFGSGSGTVVLRRLEDALADGDHIWAVIKGSAVNNDGAAKAGYLAPSVDGQAAAVAGALEAAQITADTIDYVECHGTGTYLGDPIEVGALTEAFRRTSADVGHCRIGSVKTNIGHLDTAAGVAGLIKTALALHHRQIPPSLGYEAPNPAIDLETSPFRVNDRLTEWTSHKGPRRAGVNALGVGGTNAHVVLEEAPERGAPELSDWPFHVLCLSGKSRAALDANTQALAAHLRAHPDLPLADVAHTLKNGRRGFDKRRVLVAETATEAAELLESGDARRVFTHDRLGQSPEVVFMFPGGGAQYAGMARDLYETEPVFAEWMDRGLDHLQPLLDYDIRALWLPDPQAHAEAERILTKPSVQLPLIMIVEYALAQLWLSWGVRPAALVGHSMGENTAACLAGVIGFEDCIDLVLLRGRLFDRVPAGGMLSVSLPVDELRALIGDDLDIASVNAPRLTAVSGPQAALDRLAETLVARDIDHQRVPIDIAAHSRMLDPILAEFGAFLHRIDLHPPTLPILSNRTGQPLRDDQATDPDYWVGQLRNTVLFGDCITALAVPRKRVFLEVGPGKALSALAQMSDSVTAGQVIGTLRHPDQDIADDAYFIGMIGRLWACGVEADWSQIWGDAKRQRLPLPTYAFQRSRFFVEPGKPAAIAADPVPIRHQDIADWGYRPFWRAQFAPCDLDVETDLDSAPHRNWLIFEDDAGIAARVCERLEQAGQTVTRVSAGDSYAQLDANRFVLVPEDERAGYDRLIADLARAGRLPDRIGHFWLVTESESHRPGSSFPDRNLERGFYSLTGLAQALAGASLPESLHVTVVTNGAAQVRDEPLPWPEKAIVAGPAGVIPREFPGLTCALLDIELPQQARSGGWAGWRKHAEQPGASETQMLTARLLEELLAEPHNSVAAWRGARRMVQGIKPVELADDATGLTGLRDGGTYLITGGLGGIGLAVADDLIARHGANVVLVSRTTLPPHSDWPDHLARLDARDPLARRIRAVQALEDRAEESRGGAVMLAQADVCNVQQMRTVVEAATARFGPTSGVIHAAGTIDDGPLLAKSPEEIEAVLAPKITGLRVLDTLFPDGTLDLMVLFSSSSTVTRPAGQIDYVAGNEYLNAFAKHRRGGKTRVCAINWGVWAGAGMAAEAVARRTGTAHVTDWAAITAPMLDETGTDANGNRVFRAQYDVRDRWVLDGHRTAEGTALMPGTGFVELAAEALAAQGSAAAFEIRDLYFLRALRVDDDAPREAVLRLEPDGDSLALGIYMATATGSAPGYLLNAQARMTPLRDAKTPDPLDLAAIGARCTKVASDTTGARLRTPQERHLKFGPRWHVLNRTATGAGEGLAYLALPPDLRTEDKEYILHPGLLDLATGWGLTLVPGYGGAHLWVPLSYRKIRVFAALPAEFCSWIRLASDRAGTDGFASFDITLCDRAGRICAEIEGFEMKRMAEGLDLTEPERPDTGAAALGLVAAQTGPLSPDERRLFHNIEQGIRPEEGPEALRRALATGLPQVTVSSLDLPALIAQSDHAAAPAAEGGQSFERPDLDSTYVAPRTPIEKTLAGLWEGLLGIDRVGVDDDFFDLGGHSLIAVRLFAQINRTYDVQFPISVLFQAPTVAACAALIAHQTGHEDRQADADAPDVAPNRATGPDFTHLVTLHQGGTQGRRPFFLVAGMFGNVLNLRHLALKLGRDRAVYGLQARGLIGDDAPHRTMEAAAADYISELRRIQPHGPYFLGGFSGGGITAFEMAHQLAAAGERVELLAMLDTLLPVRPTVSRRDKLLVKMQEFRRRGVRYLGEWASARISWELSRRRGDAPDTPDAQASFNNRKIEAAFMEATARYVLRRWGGPVVLFRPPLDRHWKVTGGRWVSAAKEFVLDDNGWTEWAPQTRVIEVPGDHDSMVLTPNVSVLADRLRQCIEDAEHSIPVQPEDGSQTLAAE